MMGLSWQQGPLATGSVGHFLVPDPLPDRMPFAHAADLSHRNGIRETSRHLEVRDGDSVVAVTTEPLVLFESGFAPRWYVPRADVEESLLTLAEGQTFCPYKGLASYYDIGE